MTTTRNVELAGSIEGSGLRSTCTVVGTELVHPSGHSVLNQITSIEDVEPPLPLGKYALIYRGQMCPVEQKNIGYGVISWLFTAT